MEKYDNEKKLNKLSSNEFQSESPDFIQKEIPTKENENFEDYLIPEKEFFDHKHVMKQLLLIGFEDKPKGINPMNRKKSPMT